MPSSPSPISASSPGARCTPSNLPMRAGAYRGIRCDLWQGRRDLPARRAIDVLEILRTKKIPAQTREGAAQRDSCGFSCGLLRVVAARIAGHGIANRPGRSFRLPRERSEEWSIEQHY
jgi:hypothetical protein